MKDTNRSLGFAILACLAMSMFARSPQFSGDKSILTIALALSTLVLSIAGFWLGLRGARKQRTVWSWLAPFVNALTAVSFLAFFFLMLKTVANLK